MTDFVIEKYETTSNPTLFEETVFNYANFLKQPLEIGMFVPCDNYGNVLEQNCDVINERCRDCSCREFQKAQSKVLFEGFSFEDFSFIESCYCLLTNENIVLKYCFETYETLIRDDDGNYVNSNSIEDLIPYNLDLAVCF